MFLLQKLFYENLSTGKKTFLFHGNLLFLNPFKVISIKVCAELDQHNIHFPQDSTIFHKSEILQKESGNKLIELTNPRLMHSQ